MTTDDDMLTDTHDLIVDAIWNAANGRSIPFSPHDLAAAVLPIVAVEVRKAKAEALREAADSVHDNAASPYCLPCHRDDADLLHTIATEYETGDRA